MKKYVFLAPSIGNMGGAQMYLANKCIYLESQGWQVDVFYCNKFREFHIEYLKRFVANRICELSYSIHTIPFWKRKSVIKKVSDSIMCADEVIIESHMVYLAFWGEEIAKNVKGKHISNFMEENYPILNQYEISFFKFKLQRGEMLNSGQSVLKKLLKEDFCSDLMKYSHIGVFPCTNVVEEVRSFDVKFKDADYHIISVGRLDKPYVPTLVSELFKFVMQYPDYSFNIIFVGGSANAEQEKNIREKLSELKNVNIYLLGYLFPIPAQLINLSDISIASSNSVLITADYGVPTICVDAHDFGAIGIYGYTTMRRLSRESEPYIPLSKMIEDVLIHKSFQKGRRLCVDTKQTSNVFEENMQYINRSNKNKVYFNIKTTCSRNKKYCDQLKWLIHNLH